MKEHRSGVTAWAQMLVAAIVPLAIAVRQQLPPWVVGITVSAFVIAMGLILMYYVFG